MEAQELLNEIEKEEKQIINHRQDKPRSLCLEVMMDMTTSQIKQCQEFFKVQDDQEKADSNITLILRCLK
jgi:hypothetical protein